MKLRVQFRSIAVRLILAVLAVELLSAVLVVALSYGYERHIHFHAFDVLLRGRADSILGAVQDADDAGDNLILDKADLHIPPEDIYEVWDDSGHLLGRSANWDGSGTGGPDVKPEHPWGEYTLMEANGHHYRLLRELGSRRVDPGEKDGGKVRGVTVVYGSQTGHVWHVIHGAVQFYALGSLALLLVTGPLIAWLLHRGMLPLRQLAALAAEVSVDSWHFSPPDSARRTPELAPLTHALESVLQRLEVSFLQQKAFVSDAAHELKTAVAVIKSSLQLLNMKKRSPQEYQAGLERCLADSLRLESLVADMLALARAENAEASGTPRGRSDLAVCIAKTVAQLETVAELCGVKVTVMEQAAGAVAVAEEDCGLLLSNLLLNALQHSPAGAVVELVSAVEGQMALVTIQDQGDGIPAAALPHVFDRFYRGDPSRTRNTGGTGLGLAICKAIVEKAGGQIAIASRADEELPDRGTTVTVRLPLVG